MVETFAALLFAHVLADFVLQGDRMARAKAARAPGAMAAHIAIVWVTATVAVGRFDAAVLGLAVAHLAIDLAKTFAPQGLTAFLADQAAHLVSLVLVAGLAGGLWSSGIWVALLPDALAAALPALMAVAAGGVLATRAGGFAMDLLFAAIHAPRVGTTGAADDGLPGGGRVIGHLERALILLLVLAGQTAGVGFLIAAKSVLRFGVVRDDRAASEYVIIGTLASFGWALAVSFATVELLAALGARLPLGIAAEVP